MSDLFEVISVKQKSAGANRTLIKKLVCHNAEWEKTLHKIFLCYSPTFSPFLVQKLRGAYSPVFSKYRFMTLTLKVRNKKIWQVVLKLFTPPTNYQCYRTESEGLCFAFSSLIDILSSQQNAQNDKHKIFWDP